MTRKRTIGVVLFPGFELLDVFGPLEMYGIAKEHFDIRMVAQSGGEVASAQGPKSVVDYTFDDAVDYDILLVPGGMGTRREVKNDVLLSWLKTQAEKVEHMTSVCTGSALLARAGILGGIRATTNKAAYGWVISQGPEVLWQAQARWVEDGKFFTSSGVSAGIDMSLALIEKLQGEETAENVAAFAEYDRHRDADWDPFAELHGLV